MTKILGISAYYHDSAACLVVDGKIVCAAQEERFTRIKNDHSFPANAIQFCLEQANIDILDVDIIVYYEKPFLKFERILETYITVAPRGVLSFIYSMPKWINGKLFFKRKLRNDFKKIYTGKLKSEIYYSEHHLSHAAFAFFTSPFKEALIISVDAVGEWETTTLFYAKGNKITKLLSQNFPNSVGILYSAFTYYLGFKVNSGEYKLMGLAAYGNEDDIEFLQFLQDIRSNIVLINDDGSIRLNQEYFKFQHTLTIINDSRWNELFSMVKRDHDSPIFQAHCNLALAIQRVTEEIIIKLAKTSKQIKNCDNLCLAGGVALNCSANGKIVEEKIYKNIYVPYSPGDSGSAIGCALAIHHIYLNNPYKGQSTTLSPYLGPAYLDKHVKLILEKFNLSYDSYDDTQLSKITAECLSKGQIVGWFQGSSEFGPRALGNRSILADSRILNIQNRINIHVKFREHFRPFAPSILEEDAEKYFECTEKSPYMQFISKVNIDYIDQPYGYELWNIEDKLSYKKSAFPAITHVDFSSRFHTVSKNVNYKFWNLLRDFKEITSCPMILNTSFNKRGEPIVNTPEQAIDCFLKSNLDILVINNFIIKK